MCTRHTPPTQPKYSLIRAPTVAAPGPSRRTSACAPQTAGAQHPPPRRSSAFSCEKRRRVGLYALPAGSPRSAAVKGTAGLPRSAARPRAAAEGAAPAPRVPTTPVSWALGARRFGIAGMPPGRGHATEYITFGGGGRSRSACEPRVRRQRRPCCTGLATARGPASAPLGAPCTSRMPGPVRFELRGPAAIF